MMFRSLLFAAVPLLVAGEVEEQSVLLQLKGRDETRTELLHRSKADLSQQTLRTLEENLIAKSGSKVPTAKCSYYLQTPKNGMSPCETLDVLEETFDKSMKEFGEFEKVGKKTIKSVMKTVKESLTNLRLPTTDGNLTLGINAEVLEVQKLTYLFGETIEKLGDTDAADEMRTAVEGLTEEILASVRETVTEAENHIMTVLEGKNVTSHHKTLINPVEVITDIVKDAKKGLKEAEEMLENYVDERFEVLMNRIGNSMASFWVSMLKNPATTINDLVKSEIFWNSPKDLKLVQKSFWHFAQAYLDDVNTVESDCKSANFNWEKASEFPVKKICKSNKKPKCLDELTYFYGDLEATVPICKVTREIPRKVRGKMFTDAAFLDHCDVTGSECQDEFMNKHSWSSCKKPNDVKKACDMIEKWQKAEEKAAKKACQKACNDKDEYPTRKDRKECKKECDKE